MFGEYSYTNVYESEDSRRSGSRVEYVSIYSILTNEQQNPDGTYSYEYNIEELTSFSSLNEEENKKGFILQSITSGIKSDIHKLIQVLIGKYNLHEFIIEDSNIKVSKKDYKLKIEKLKEYSILSEERIEEKYSMYKKMDSTNRLNYTELLEKRISEQREKESIRYSVFSKHEVQRTEKSDKKTYLTASSIDELNTLIKNEFIKNSYISYLLGESITKNYVIELSLADIGEFENIEDYLNLIEFEFEIPKTISEAIELGIITYDEIKQYIENNKKINGIRIPVELLDKIFQDRLDLITHFSGDSLPRELSEKYNVTDYSLIPPKDLKLEDLDAVLQIPREKINSKFIMDIYNRNNGRYYEYFEKFYNNPEALKKILRRSNEFLIQPYTTSAEDLKFVNYIISNNLLSNDEVREAILSSESRKLNEILSYNIKFDKESIYQLFDIVKKEQSCKGDVLEEGTLFKKKESFVKLVEICRENEIEDTEILELLKSINFEIGIINRDHLKDIKISGVRIKDIEKQVLNNSNFSLIELLENKNENELTNLYKMYLKDVPLEKKNEKIIEMYKKDNIASLISRISMEEKREFLNVILSNKSLEIKDIKKIVEFDLDLKTKDYQILFLNILNNSYLGRNHTEQAFLECFSKEDRELIKRHISKVYPAPKKGWEREGRVVKIANPNSKNRNEIKGLIQKEGSCFSTSIITSMQGVDENGNPIKVNNLSKWLFGVPGARGNLYVSRDGNYIILPENTPEEAINMIQHAINPERQKKER